jgi:hypothetical protein
MTYWHTQFFKKRPDGEETRLLEEKSFLSCSTCPQVEYIDNSIVDFRCFCIQIPPQRGWNYRCCE